MGQDPTPNTVELTEKIIGCAFSVVDGLGSGFLEKVYENAMVVELQKAGLKTEAQNPSRSFIEMFWSGSILPTWRSKSVCLLN